MSLVSVEFDELYARHLCRHSQLGINVAHLGALFGIWYAVYAAAYALSGTPWVPVALAGAYFLVLLPSTPLRVLAAVALFLGVLVAAVVSVPPLPAWAFWAYLLAVPLCYKLQAYSHKVWDVERDMTEFNRKYTKGFVLFVVLLFYEVPIVLNYLVYDRKRWA
jgi:hypothetical protein